MKKPLSNMTPQEFVEYTGALNLNYSRMADALGKKPSTVSCYVSGRHPIPQDVADRIFELTREMRKKLELNEGKQFATRHSMIVHHNERKRERGEFKLHPTVGRFMRRQRKPDTNPLPAYRMTAARVETFMKALAGWQAHVVALSREYADAARQKDYRLERVDITAIANSIPRHAPYDIRIERCQWDVVSRALRHAGTPAAIALQAHWNRHRGAGFPKRPTIISPQE